MCNNTMSIWFQGAKVRIKTFHPKKALIPKRGSASIILRRCAIITRSPVFPVASSRWWQRPDPVHPDLSWAPHLPHSNIGSMNPVANTLQRKSFLRAKSWPAFKGQP